MRIPKRFDGGRQDTCPFCGKNATVTTGEGLLVCSDHRNDSLPFIRCTCGEILEQRAGKFGPYFNCFSCGNISFAKGMELKAMQVPKKSPKPGVYVDGEYVPSIDEL